jgi:soluble P-type ATPase
MDAQRRELIKQLASVFIEIYIASNDARVEQKAA